MRSMRRAFELYVTALQQGDESGVQQILTDAGADSLSIRSFLRRSGPHTLPTRLLIAGEVLSARLPQGRTRRLLAAGRSFASEVVATIGDGVLLHPPHPRVAPRHGTIVWRPLSITPVVVFNLAGVPGHPGSVGTGAKRPAARGSGRGGPGARPSLDRGGDAAGETPRGLGSPAGLADQERCSRIRSTASASRSSGVVSEMRKKPSPLGPYIDPGEMTTPASSSTSSANEVEVCPSGTGAQT